MENDYYDVLIFLCDVIRFKSNSVLKTNDLYSKYKKWHELFLPKKKILPICIITKYIIHEFGEQNKDGNFDDLFLLEQKYNFD